MKKILIIEDDKVLGDVMLHKLQNANFEVEITRQGDLGFQKIKEWKPDLIVMDMYLPKMNGLELLEAKKLDQGVAGIPVILLANSEHLSQRQGVESLGVNELLVKIELTPEVLLIKVNHLLNGGSGSSEKKASENILANKKVLLVEDDEFLATILSARIKSHQAEVHRVKSGEQAQDAMKAETFDILLLDVLLPGMTGFEVLDGVRADEKTKNLPVIIVSNYNQVADIQRASSQGAMFLVKALVNPDDIVKEMSKMLDGPSSKTSS